MPVNGAISQHGFLFPSGQVGESFRGRRITKGVEAIPVDARKPDEGLLQLFPMHTLDRIAPQALDFSDGTHGCDLPWQLVWLVMPAKRAIFCSRASIKPLRAPSGASIFAT